MSAERSISSYPTAEKVFLIVSEKILKRVKEIASSSSKEVIGLLLGSAELNMIRVLGHYTGPQMMMKTRVRLSNRAVAWAARELTKEGARNSLIGWYHSHPGFGVFLSHRDLKTHSRFTQIFPLTVALVIDPVRDETGFFIAPLNVPLRIPEKNILIKREGEGREEFESKYRELRRRGLESLKPYYLCPVCHSPVVLMKDLGGRGEGEEGVINGGLVVYPEDHFLCLRCGRRFPGAALPLCPKCDAEMKMDIDKGAFYCEECGMHHYPIKGIKRIVQIRLRREEQRIQWPWE